MVFHNSSRKKEIVGLIVCVFIATLMSGAYLNLHKGKLKEITSVKKVKLTFLDEKKNQAKETSKSGKTKYRICVKESPFEYGSGSIGTVSPSNQTIQQVSNSGIPGSMLPPRLQPSILSVNGNGPDTPPNITQNVISRPESLPDAGLPLKIKGIISGSGGKCFAILSRDNEQIVVSEGMETKWGKVAVVSTNGLGINIEGKDIEIVYDIESGNSKVINPKSKVETNNMPNP